MTTYTLPRRCRLTLIFAFAAIFIGVVKAEQPLPFVPPMTPELKAGLAYCEKHDIPVFDMHIHLRGGMTAEKAAIRQEKTGIKSGVLENYGRDWPLSDDAKLRAFIADARKHPVLVGIQVNDRDWYKTIAPEVLKQLDFVLADTMIMGTNADGKPRKLWINDYEIPDPEAWMEEYMAHNLRILGEPISILANPTYLPAQIAHLYDELWTDERMETIIRAAVENGVALEIQAEAANADFCKKRFFTLAKKHGAMISLGTNNFNDKPIPMDVCFRLVEELELKPRAWRQGEYKQKLAKKSPPNVIIIFTDDQGYSDVGVFGAEGFKTPNLDTLAASGGVYTNFYVAANACSPSRAALMTGCYPHRVSLPHVLFPTRGENPGPGKDGLHPNEITMAELLKPAGYATACVGKWHLGNAKPFLPTNQGFDMYFGLPYSNDMQRRPGRMDYPPLPLMEGEKTIETQPDQRFLTRRYTEKAVSFIRENKDKPFFLYLAHSMPHAPLAVSPEFAGKSELGIYGDVIQEIDWSVGEIMKTLDELCLADNTLVVFTSDNGPWLSYGEEAGHCVPLRQGKGTCYEGGHRVACVMRWPGTIPQGTVSGEIITSMDIYPTIARLAGVKLPDDRKIDGVDMTDFLAGKDKSPRDTYFYELSAVRHGDWKLYAPGNYREYCKDDLDRKTKTGTRRYFSVKYDNYRLYNLADDISETRDLYAEQPEIAEKLKTLLESHRRDMRENARPLGDVRKMED